MKDRAKEILSTRMPEGLKEHIKKVAKPNVNAWAVKLFIKASKFKVKECLEMRNTKL